MGLLGQAVADAGDSWRVNDAIDGNSDEFLHAHVSPRYRWESEERRQDPVWQYPMEMWQMPTTQYAEALHGDLRARITQQREELMGEAVIMNTRALQPRGGVS